MVLAYTHLLPENTDGFEFFCEISPMGSLL
jgi:hypothetical protein